MFLFLSKFLPLFFYPLGIALLALLVAAVLRRPKLRTGLILAALILLWLSSNRLVSMLLIQSLEWRVPALEEVPQVDAIVVLGGGTREGNSPRPYHEVNEGGDRMLYAARLYRQGAAPVVLLSGGNGPWHNPGQLPETAAMLEILTLAGVPETAVLQETSSRNTYENARECYRILQERGMTRILLVTSAMHMPRAYQTFQKYDLTVIPAPADYLVTHSDWNYVAQRNIGIQLMNLMPDAEYLRFTSSVLKEYMGLAMYRLKGWL